ncbi:NADPH-dependent FMN reductase [Methanoregula boonei 6A8]|uniref:NADPH-dependent FMN reductase n=1 Tax=Methanoregula boonei (strain DSM 21154 / JCM 14090 / 6A8) TaxID=456442 RepID=A7I480_METB6|nr:flavodoxin family protein [Methanoregula boonei]ABS54541.1 NADPH-dependent FMN reductase [Methanoregula boonei 6A8]
MAKVVAFNGSPRKDGNTSILIGHIFAELETEGITTELVQVGKKKIRGCTACMKCFEKKDGHCVFDDDIVNTCIDKMVDADGVILGSPVYFLDVTAEMKGLIDRAGFVSMANGGLYRRRVGMAVAAVRRSGGSRTIDTLLHFLLAGGMVVPGFPVIGVGREIGDVNRDEEGIGRARDAGKNMAWLIKTMEKAKES